MTKLLTAKEFASEINIAQHQVYRMIKRGHVACQVPASFDGSTERFTDQKRLALHQRWNVPETDDRFGTEGETPKYYSAKLNAAEL
jgi:hypothetical protein